MLIGIAHSTDQMREIRVHQLDRSLRVMLKEPFHSYISAHSLLKVNATSLSVLYAAATAPNRYCAQFRLPSGRAHRRSPTSEPAAPAATCIGRICSKLGCAALASLRFSNAIIAAWRPSGSTATASFTPSSKLEA